VRHRRFGWLVAALLVTALSPFLVGAPRVPAVARAISALPASILVPAPASAKDFEANFVLEPVYFDAGRSSGRPGDTRILDAHAVWLRRNQNQLLLVEGHSDGPGGNATTLAIGEQRALWAKKYLVSKGVDSGRIETISRGGDRPMCVERTAACRANNRRASFLTKGR
jgi:peptidoglycan-associated lipoprotein